MPSKKTTTTHVTDKRILPSPRFLFRKENTFCSFVFLSYRLLHLLHEVQILVGDSEKAAKGKPHTQVYKLDEKLRSLVTSLALHKEKNRFAIVGKIMGLQTQYCDSLFNNKDMMEEVKTADLIIGDSIYLCSSLVAAKFSLPHVTIAMSNLDTATLLACGVHNPPSYVPHALSGLAGDQFSFFQRVQNTFNWIIRAMMFHFLICPIYEEIKVKHNIAPNKSISETLGRVDLIIGQVDFPIDVPRPLLPSKYLDIQK